MESVAKRRKTQGFATEFQKSGAECHPYLSNASRMPEFAALRICWATRLPQEQTVDEMMSLKRADFLASIATLIVTAMIDRPGRNDPHLPPESPYLPYLTYPRFRRSC
jgi:hypothetical protein